QRRVGVLDDYVEAQAAEQRARRRFDIHPPGAGGDVGFHREGAVAAAASAADNQGHAAPKSPASFWFIELPLVDDLRVERSGRENRAVGVRGRTALGVKCLGQAEEPEQVWFL